MIYTTMILCNILFQIDRGLVVYVCFMKGATEDILEKMGMCVVFIPRAR